MACERAAAATAAAAAAAGKYISRKIILGLDKGSEAKGSVISGNRRVDLDA